MLTVGTVECFHVYARPDHPQGSVCYKAASLAPELRRTWRATAAREELLTRQTVTFVIGQS
jgi:hypothetical protein